MPISNEIVLSNSYFKKLSRRDVKNRNLNCGMGSGCRRKIISRGCKLGSSTIYHMEYGYINFNLFYNGIVVLNKPKLGRHHKESGRQLLS